MEIIKQDTGFQVKLSASDMEILAWAEKRDPNEILSVLQNWLNHRRVARDNGDAKDLKAAFDQLPEELRAKIKEKIDELGSKT